MRSARGAAVGVLVLGLFACAPKASLPVEDNLPARCVVRWQGPGEHCAVPESFRAEAVGSNAAEATALARARLAAGVRSGVRALALDADARRRTGVAEKSAACASYASQNATAVCFPEATLAAARHCRVEFLVSACNGQPPQSVRGRPWTTGERARSALCAGLAVPESLDPGEAAGCISRCYQETRLLCQ
jgi:hypothetical protein